MTGLPQFVRKTLTNRLGQMIELNVLHQFAFGRECVLVTSAVRQASSLVAKNAEHLAFQLRELFGLDARRFDLIECRGDAECPEFWRWRFEWVGNSPLAPKSEKISSPQQYSQFSELFLEGFFSRQAALQAALQADPA